MRQASRRLVALMGRSAALLLALLLSLTPLPAASSAVDAQTLLGGMPCLDLTPIGALPPAGPISAPRP